MLALEVLDGLLLRIGIEINDGRRCLKYDIVYCLEEKKRSRVIFLLSAGFCMVAGQGCSQRGAAGTRLSVAPRGILARLGGVAKP